MAVKVLVIGVGNPLRRDDGAGPVVARRLHRHRHVQTMACHQLTPELAEAISQARLVVFVDAHAGLKTGEVRTESVEPRVAASMHQVDPGTLLEWSRKLYGRAPEAMLVGIGGESFEMGEGLSPAVERATREAAALIESWIGAGRCSAMVCPTPTD